MREREEKTKRAIRLSDHFGYGRLLRFVLPSVIMAIFTSVYTIVDGVFISNFAGESAFAGLNLVFPVLMILGAFGLMFGSGGSALIAKTLGEGDKEKANGYFTLFVLSVVVIGVVFGAIGIGVLPPVVKLLGKNAKPETVQNGILYGRIYLCGLPVSMLQYCFQNFFITAEKPRLGFFVTVGAGLCNAFFDWLFIVPLQMGLAGAAIATVMGQAIGGILPLIYFARKNSSLLRFRLPRFDWKALLKGAANGSSELLANISVSVVGILYNTQLLKFAGDNGVIAYGVFMYIGTVFFNLLFGYYMGMAPIVSYHYGAESKAELKNLKRKSLVIAGVLGVTLTALTEALALPFAKIFVHTDELIALTVEGTRLCSLQFLFVGFGIFGSAFFTALNNGGVSAALSFLRTLVLPVITISCFPLLWGITGIWIAATISDAVASAVTLLVLFAYRKRYGY